MSEQEKPQEPEVEDATPTSVATEEAPEGAETEEQDAVATEEAESPEGEPEAPAESEPTPEYEPFGFTADKRRFDVEGAQLVRFKDKDGNVTENVVIPRDSWNRFVQPQLRDGSAVHRRELDYKRQIDGLAPDKNETVVRAKALLGELEGVLQSEESLTAFLQNFQQNKELWQLKAEKAVNDARLNGFKSQEDERSQATRNEEFASEIVQDIPSFTATAAQWVTQNWNTPVDQRALAAAQQQIAENIGAYYRLATEADAQAYGVQVGELVRDDDQVLKTIHRFASLMGAGKKVEDVKAKNAAALGTGKPAPKVVSAKGSPAGADKPKSFKNADEWRKHMGLNT